ncbi:hypothetical protein F5Y16DRAFT_389744 [Xylariaceae sp. FL0255]|nr:hypothetical protein F5Y16DRAFT_389744 [Xylariaceae sp. FL0255]
MSGRFFSPPFWLETLMNNISTKEYGLLHDFVLVLSLVILINTHRHRIRSVAATMADTLSPKTPKKLFKPSSKTKTTPVRRLNQSTSSTLSNTSATQQSYPRPPSSARSTVSSVEQSTESLRKVSPDDIFKTTNLAPLTDSSAVASGKLADLTGSDTASEPPIGLIDREGVVTPTPDLSQSAALPADAPASPNARKKLFRVKSTPKKSTSEISVDKPQESLKNAIESIPEAPPVPTEKLRSPAELAKYFEEQGYPEMSQFVTALIGDQTRSPSDTSDKAPAPSQATKSAGRMTDRLQNASPNPMDELPTDENLVAEPNERTKRAVADAAKDTTDKLDNPQATKSATSSSTKSIKGASDIPDLRQPKPADISKTAEGTFRKAQDKLPANVATNKMGEPDAAKISRTAQPTIPKSAAQLAGQARGVPDRSISHSSATSGFSSLTKSSMGSRGQSTAKSPSVGPDGTRYVDNMGSPTHIERRIEVPFQRPQKVVDNSPKPDKPSNGLGDVNDLPSTEGLPNVNDLPDIPDDDSQDPPEEVLDPSVHLSSTSITPIPKIPKITPIGSSPPVDLGRLAQGLSGHAVDDVGNVVDESGKVLGHATGDLPAMIGKKVSESGEVYGDEGEIIGYVSENFVNPPQPTEIPSEVLGGLKVDHEGNILDANGNVIGKFHQKPGANGALPPFMQSTTPQAEEKPKEEQKPKVNAHTGGSPSDIFLDVKSTTDGIQLTIRIPTTFSRQPQE